MLNIFLPISFVILAIFFLLLSKSKKNYQKLVESSGEKFASQITRGLKVCGYLIFICSVIWLSFNYIFQN
jgi:hypothetical protein